MTKNALLKKFDRINQKRPLLAGTLVGSQSVSSQVRHAEHAAIDLLECRIDTFPSLYRSGFFFMTNVLLTLRKKWGKPILLTLRAASEGGWLPKGVKPLTDRQRLALLIPCLKFVDLIDVEIRHAELARGLARRTRTNGPAVVHSYHDFKGIGRWPDVTRAARRSKKWSGDYFKLAVRTDSDEDLARFFLRADGLSNRRKILIGMGKKGLISRYAAYSLGSKMTYGHLGRPAAPGQPSALELRAGLRRLYGN